MRNRVLSNFVLLTILAMLGLTGCVSGPGDSPPSKTVAASVAIALTDPVTGATLASISSGKPAKVSATVRDTAGAVVPNLVVSFTTDTGLATMSPSTGTALTDASGVATIQISTASLTAAGATTISAAATVDTTAVSASVGYSVIATTTGVTGISLALTSPSSGLAVTSISTGNPAKVTATVRDAAGTLVSNAVVSFSTNSSLATMIPASGTALTDAFGVAWIQIASANPQASGATTISATASVGGNTLSSSVGFSVIPTSTGATGVSVALTNPTTGAAVASISLSSPAKVTATVRDTLGAVVPNVVVTFATSASLATMVPAATALTDGAGVASIQIVAASPAAAGATTVSATATVEGASVSGSAGFSVTPTNVGSPGVTVVLTDSSGKAVSSISPGNPAKVVATIRDATGSGVPNAVVSFATNPSLATMTPASGTALTNASGVASIQIDAAGLTAAGATTISATANVSGASVTGSTGYSVSAANAVLGTMTVATNPLSPYATTSVSVPVSGVGSTPVTINFSSICAGTGKATLPVSVQTVNAVATATYTDKGCASTDTITASVAGLAVTATTTIVVQTPGATSIQFVSATPSTIVLKGTGGAGLVESALVKFKVVDSNNAPIVGADVSLDLTTRTGGILLDGSSAEVRKKTDGNGEVSVSVQSGTAPTAVWVRATVTSVSPTFSSQSSVLRISTGRPAQDRFSIGASTHNIEGWSTNGVTTTVGVIASDRLGNPVPDGTAINFIAEGAQIVPSCATVNGACSVTFTSANPHPTGDDEPNHIVTAGRVTVLAYALGEESFSDLYGDNIYHGPGGAATDARGDDPFNDLGDVFIDNNEDGTWQAGEQFIAFNSASSNACVSGIATSPTAPSKAATCDGRWGAAHVRQKEVIVLSGVNPDVSANRPGVGRFITSQITYSMGGATTCTKAFSFYVFDENKNPMPAKTALVTVSPPASLGTVTISPSTVQDSTAAGGTFHTLQISKPTTTDPDTNLETCVTLGLAGVPLSISVTTPGGMVTTWNNLFLIKD